MHIGLLNSKSLNFLFKMSRPFSINNFLSDPSVNTPLISPEFVTTVIAPKLNSVIFIIASVILVSSETIGLILLMASFTFTIINRVSVINCSVPKVVKLFSVSCFKIFNGTVIV